MPQVADPHPTPPDPGAFPSVLRCDTCGRCAPCTPEEFFCAALEAWPLCCARPMSLIHDRRRKPRDRTGHGESANATARGRE